VRPPASAGAPRAPASSSSRAAPAWPARQQIMSGVSPAALGRFTAAATGSNVFDAAAARSVASTRRTSRAAAAPSPAIAPPPARAAACSGVSPVAPSLCTARAGFFWRNSAAVSALPIASAVHRRSASVGPPASPPSAAAAVRASVGPPAPAAAAAAASLVAAWPIVSSRIVVQAWERRPAVSDRAR
jgi:hypothetical protein